MAFDWSTLPTPAVKEARVTKIPPNSFNSADYMARYNCGSTKARSDLRKLVAEFKLKKTMVVVGHALTAYYTAIEPEVKLDHAGRPGRVDRVGRRRRS